jgi:hypothetical protein
MKPDGAGRPDNGRPPVGDKTRYSHLDSTTTIGLSASRGAKPHKTIRHDGRRSSRIVQHFADGSQRVTFIYWAV